MDLSRFRRYDRKWRVYCSLVIEQIEREDLASIQNMRTLTRLSLLGAGGLESPRQVNAELINNAQLFTHYLQPWTKLEDLSEDAQRQAAMEEYKTKIGDPNDPEFKAKLDREWQRLRTELDGDAALRQAEAVKAHAERVARLASAQKRQRVIVH